MKTLLRDKTGMTLIELVIGMLIFVILTASVSAILVPTLRIYQRANDLAEMNTLLDNLANEITGDLKRAKEVSFTASGVEIAITDYHTVVYEVDSGFLKRNGVYVLPEYYYKNRTVSIEYYDGGSYDESIPLASLVPADDSSTSFVISVMLSKSGGIESIHREYAVRPLILNQ